MLIGLLRQVARRRARIITGPSPRRGSGTLASRAVEDGDRRNEPSGELPKTIVVGGSQRSGTTLLQKVLTLDPVASPMLREASYLRYLLEAYHRGRANFDGDTRDYFSDLNEYDQFNTALLVQFIRQTARRFPNAACLVLKEPHLTLFLPDLHRALGRSRFVIMVRDPRDIVASLIEVGRRMAHMGQRHFFAQRDIEALTRHALSFYEPVFRSRQPDLQDRLLFVRYEDLVGPSARSLENIERHTGLQIRRHLARLDHVVPEGSASETRYRPWLTELYAAGISARSVGSFRGILSAEEAERVGELSRRFRQRFGYD